MVDDGSGTMEVRSFDQSLPTLEVGNLVRVVGRPRVYNDQLYISMEIMVKLDDTKWLAWHQKLLEHFAKERPEVPGQEEVHVDEITEEEHDYEPILSMIDEMDTGEGVDMEAVKEKLDVPDPQGLLEKLLLHGEIFEIRPGRIKVLR
jgi:RPA family protein